ncbi:hypothetical protein [Mycolicibacterium aubagnense]|uniref:PE domain-containing protein n=1 Tax=Mycolicibacterium aubagnense TaxID=319707 RepID=A0ABN5YMV5_9MYCO|nr:hypothetical protein [Mycolicibacterium aubagnense]BBX82245.1 hypothetical protein MAUB_01180 [Mycolicibacterium aubagnense]
MTAAIATPSAAPMHTIAPLPTVAPAPAPVTPVVISPADIVSSICATADPAAVLSHVVLAVAGNASTAARQGQLLAAVKGSCESMLKAVREALLSSVSDAPGAYDGFTVTASAGSRSLDYGRLEAAYPDVYDELVKVGAAKLNVKFTH